MLNPNKTPAHSNAVLRRLCRGVGGNKVFRASSTCLADTVAWSSVFTSGLGSFYAIQRALKKPSKETLTPQAVLQLQRTITNWVVQSNAIPDKSRLSGRIETKDLSTNVAATMVFVYLS